MWWLVPGRPDAGKGTLPRSKDLTDLRGATKPESSRSGANFQGSHCLELTLPRAKGLRCKKHGADRLSQFAHDAESIPGFSAMTRSVAEHAPLRKGISGMGPLQSTLHHADEGDRGERFEGKGSK